MNTAPRKSKGIPVPWAVAVFVVFAGILTALAIPRLDMPVKGRNAITAQNTLRTMSTAVENYYQSNQRVYPTSMEDLLSASLPYINVDYCQDGTEGYTYECSFSKDGYVFKAIPRQETKTRQDRVFTIKTDGLLE